jgi:RNA polymerase sigma factor for flagellar operon FliA
MMDREAALQRWLAQGGPEAKEACFEAWLPLVKRVLSRLKVSLPPAADALHDDLCQVGCLGLWQAVEGFQSAKGAPFEAWARLKIRGAMLDELRRQDWISKESRRRWKGLQTAVASLEQALGRVCSEEELAAHLGLSPEALRELLLENAPGTAVFLDALMPDGHASWAERLADGREAPADAPLQRQELKEALARAIGGLPPQEHRLLVLLLEEELGHKEAALVLGVSPGRVSQIYAKAVLHLQAALAGHFN